jgi:hypothetical protein
VCVHMITLAQRDSLVCCWEILQALRKVMTTPLLCTAGACRQRPTKEHYKLPAYAAPAGCDRILHTTCMLPPE